MGQNKNYLLTEKLVGVMFNWLKYFDDLKLHQIGENLSLFTYTKHLTNFELSDLTLCVNRYFCNVLCCAFFHFHSLFICTWAAFASHNQEMGI